MKLMRIGVNLAKNVFQIHDVDRHEQPVWRQRLPRDRWLQTVLEKIEPGCNRHSDSDFMDPHAVAIVAPHLML